MSTQYYIGVIHKEDSSDFGVSFPDFPGCITAGETIDEAKDMAIEALKFHVEGMIEDNLEITPPSKLEQIHSNPEYESADCFLTIPVEIKSSKSKRINISLPEDLIDQIDKFSKQKGLSRSKFMAKASLIVMSDDLIEDHLK